MLVWPALFEAGSVEWEDNRFWTLSYLDEEIAGYPWYRPLRLADTLGLSADPAGYLEWEDPEFWTALQGDRSNPIVLAGSLTVEIDDRQNPTGYVEMGLCEIARAGQVTVNFARGAQYGFSGRTLTQEADGGTKYFRRRPKQRTFRGEVPSMPRQDALSHHFELQRINDIDVPFFWWPNPTDVTNFPRTAWLARNGRLDEFAYATCQEDRVPLNLEEVL